MVADQVSAFGHELADFVEELGHDWFPRCGGHSWQEVYRRTVLRQAPRGGPRLSLERGVRSQRAMTLAVAEMYVQGVSSRKVVTRQPPWASRTQGDQAPPRPIQAAEKATV